MKFKEFFLGFIIRSCNITLYCFVILIKMNTFDLIQIYTENNTIKFESTWISVASRHGFCKAIVLPSLENILHYTVKVWL